VEGRASQSQWPIGEVGPRDFADGRQPKSVVLLNVQTGEVRRLYEVRPLGRQARGTADSVTHSHRPQP
jgi:hypothetical protein